MGSRRARQEDALRGLCCSLGAAETAGSVNEVGYRDARPGVKLGQQRLRLLHPRFLIEGRP